MAAAKVLLPSSAALVILFLVLPSSAASGTADGSEEWGYVEVRPKAHMFWCLYRSPQRVENGTAPWPTVLWLQGGPGASGTGYGNFMEIGPLDADLKPRATTWLSKADLLFVDNPVGTGFSFVEGRNRSLMARTDAQAGGDLTALLIELYRHKTWLQGSPLYIGAIPVVVAESYGGKFAVTTALAALKAIRQGRLHAKLGGVALGDSWISPEDSVLSWGPLLYQLSRIDEKGLQQCNSLAQQIKAQLKAKQYAAAEKSWEKLESAVHQHSNNVNFYNILKDNSATDAAAVRKVGYTSYLSSKATREGGLDGLMNAEVKAKLGVVPQNFTWGEQAGDVFEALRGDFMNPRIHEVDELLKLGVEVTIYSGGTRIFTAQLDLICATKGTLDWVQKLKWEGLKKFTDAPRKPVYCKVGEAAGTQAFVKSYKNLKFYWILGSGHMVPIDNPCPALEMLGDITHSPAG
ncbi:serine carboxypeptidase-like 51 [Aegilops tauschii subsp. strangulata]|uniref:serine carboxypeptidase-like 51 n=1 Tax=Aegilops tauschii subsp. strangulata TaxID=200361 RepID=UPI00098A7859|nr:serine carboxypeptidase-like 51 [Aegilops tauschii subsp. strangulata]